MIRNRRLYESYKDRLSDKVEIFTNPNEMHLGLPWSKILPTLYDSKDEVHNLQLELIKGVTSNVNSIKVMHELINPLEEKVEALIKVVPVDSYNHLAAKVIDIGDRVDKALEKEIIKVGNDFDSQYKGLGGISFKDFEKFKEVRNGLFEKTKEYSILEDIWKSRNLPEKRISSVSEKFKFYNENLEKIKRINQDIDNVIEDYCNISSETDLKQFISTHKNKLKENHDSSNNNSNNNNNNNNKSATNLIQYAINSDHLEGVYIVRNLRKELSQFRKDHEIFIEEKEKVENNLVELEKSLRVINELGLESVGFKDCVNLYAILQNLRTNVVSSLRETYFLNKSCCKIEERTSRIKVVIEDLLPKSFTREFKLYDNSQKIKLNRDLNLAEEEKYSFIETTIVHVKEVNYFLNNDFSQNKEGQLDFLKTYQEKTERLLKLSNEHGLKKVRRRLEGIYKRIEFIGGEELHLYQRESKIVEAGENVNNSNGNMSAKRNIKDDDNNNNKNLTEFYFLPIKSKTELFDLTFQIQKLSKTPQLKKICSVIGGWVEGNEGQGHWDYRAASERIKNFNEGQDSEYCQSINGEEKRMYNHLLESANAILN